jgi:TIR domain
MSELARNPCKLFYCYAHEDKALRDALDSHLSALKRQKRIEIWYDGKISAGTEWENEIDKHLSSADIVLLLVSAAFLNSDYCYSKEMEHALQRHAEGTARVVPIIFRPVHWKTRLLANCRYYQQERYPLLAG